MIYKYCEGIETVNPQGNIHSLRSETVPLNDPSVFPSICDVTNMQYYSFKHKHSKPVLYLI